MTPSSDWFARYLAVRRRFEVGFWCVVLTLQATFNSVVTWMDLDRVAAQQPQLWQPVLWEVTSALVIGALIPAIVAFERRFPVRWDTLRAALPMHLVASLVFCVLHVGGMWWLRRAGYALLNERYDFGPWPLQLAYEYLKDVRSYAMIVVAYALTWVLPAATRMKSRTAFLETKRRSESTSSGSLSSAW